METIYLRHPMKDFTEQEIDSCVLALGFFDGVHIGHKGIIETAKQLAKEKQYAFGVMTFYPHPKDILFPDREPMTYLTPLPVKEEQFKKLGVDKLFIVEFTREFARLSPEDFVEQYINGLQCKHVVAGFDYHYGFKGSGNMDTLASAGQGKFDVTVINKIEHKDEKISSTAIRNLLSTGNVKSIPPFLGSFYEIRGQVQKANLFYNNHQFIKILVEEDFRIPKPGVYRIEVEIDKNKYMGVCHQISVIQNQPLLVVHLSNCQIDTRQKEVKVKWIQYLKAKQKEESDMYIYFERDELVI